MGTRDPRVDAYIAKQAEFAKPILAHIRDVVHAACPEVTEEIKWGSPFFMYHGGPMAHMPAFKQHVRFGFWKGKLLGGGDAEGEEGMDGPFRHLTSVKDLPSKKEMTAYIKQAMKLNEEGISARKPAKARPALPVPPELAAALAKNKKARASFDGFSASQKRDYNEWIGEAKREETKSARVKQAIEWIAEGKPRHWKYQK
jgi:uncharacterized protein YdeI (YjbR/CyaY-like superfamily)